jgi:hypothetical protein
MDTYLEGRIRECPAFPLSLGLFPTIAPWREQQMLIERHFFDIDIDKWPFPYIDALPRHCPLPLAPTELRLLLPLLPHLVARQGQDNPSPTSHSWLVACIDPSQREQPLTVQLGYDEIYIVSLLSCSRKLISVKHSLLSFLRASYTKRHLTEEYK